MDIGILLKCFKEKSFGGFRFNPDWLVGFYGISTFIGYLIPNPFLYKSILFQTVQFSISTQLVKNVSISSYSV